MIPVAIIEDHPIFRQGLAHLLQAHPDLHLVGTAGSIEDFDTLPSRPAALVLLDLHLPGLGPDQLPSPTSSNTAMPSWCSPSPSTSPT